MATSHEVKCSQKSATGAVIGIGGVNADGTRWSLSEADAIKGIENGTWTFYTYQNSLKANIQVVLIGGVKHLKTDRDTTTVNNLKVLPNCP